MKPEALDLFCGAGGVTRGLQMAGFRVTGVDVADQPRYVGDAFLKASAFTEEIVRPGNLNRYALVWASPPCQRYSSATRQSGDPERWPDFVAPIRVALRASSTRWVIENVVGAPLIDPITLCGAMFGLGVVRHRLFETSFQIEKPIHVKHAGSLVTGEYVTVAGNGGVPSWTLRERERSEGCRDTIRARCRSRGGARRWGSTGWSGTNSSRRSRRHMPSGSAGERS